MVSERSRTARVACISALKWLGFTLTGYFCKVDFVIDENGIVKLIPLNIPIQKLSGILHRKGMKPTTLEEMEEIIGEAASDWTWYKYYRRYMKIHNEHELNLGLAHDN